MSLAVALLEFDEHCLNVERHNQLLYKVTFYRPSNTGYDSREPPVM